MNIKFTGGNVVLNTSGISFVTTERIPTYDLQTSENLNGTVQITVNITNAVADGVYYLWESAYGEAIDQFNVTGGVGYYFNSWIPLHGNGSYTVELRTEGGGLGSVLASSPITVTLLAVPYYALSAHDNADGTASLAVTVADALAYADQDLYIWNKTDSSSVSSVRVLNNGSLNVDTIWSSGPGQLEVELRSQDSGGGVLLAGTNVYVTYSWMLSDLDTEGGVGITTNAPDGTYYCTPVGSLVTIVAGAGTLADNVGSGYIDITFWTGVGGTGIELGSGLVTIVDYSYNFVMNDVGNGSDFSVYSIDAPDASYAWVNTANNDEGTFSIAGGYGMVTGFQPGSYTFTIRRFPGGDVATGVSVVVIPKYTWNLSDAGDESIRVQSYDAPSGEYEYSLDTSTWVVVALYDQGSDGKIGRIPGIGPMYGATVYFRFGGSFVGSSSVTVSDINYNWTASDSGNESSLDVYSDAPADTYYFSLDGGASKSSWYYSGNYSTSSSLTSPGVGNGVIIFYKNIGGDVYIDVGRYGWTINYQMGSLTITDNGNESAHVSISNSTYWQPSVYTTYQWRINAGSWNDTYIYHGGSDWNFDVDCGPVAAGSTLELREPTTEIIRGSTGISVADIDYTWNLTDNNDQNNASITTNAPDNTYYWYVSTDSPWNSAVIVTNGSGTISLGGVTNGSVNILFGLLKSNNVDCYNVGSGNVSISPISYSWTLQDNGNESDAYITTNAPDGTYYWSLSETSGFVQFNVTYGTATITIGLCNNIAIYFRSALNVPVGTGNITISDIAYSWTVEDAGNARDAIITTPAPDANYSYSLDGISYTSFSTSYGQATIPIGVTNAVIYIYFRNSSNVDVGSTVMAIYSVDYSWACGDNNDELNIFIRSSSATTGTYYYSTDGGQNFYLITTDYIPGQHAYIPLGIGSQGTITIYRQRTDYTYYAVSSPLSYAIGYVQYTWALSDYGNEKDAALTTDAPNGQYDWDLTDSFSSYTQIYVVNGSTILTDVGVGTKTIYFRDASTVRRGSGTVTISYVVYNWELTDIGNGSASITTTAPDGSYVFSIDNNNWITFSTSGSTGTLNIGYGTYTVYFADYYDHNIARGSGFVNLI